mgnify:CR=1 FL=1
MSSNKPSTAPKPPPPPTPPPTRLIKDGHPKTNKK